MDDLAQLPLEERIRAIHRDVISGSDRYRALDPRDIAKLVGLDGAFDGDWDGWERIRYVPIPDFAELLDTHGDTKVPVHPELAQRLAGAGFTPEDSFEDWHHLATEADRERIREAIAEREMDDLCGAQVIGRYTIQREPDIILRFETTVEDDGACVDLMTPYDDRDGGFLDLGRCVWQNF